jgi:DNA-binding transcriptional ArsR family regulator
MHHPGIEEITVEGILYALSDPTRAAIYMEIASAECPQICSQFLTVKGRELPKSTLSQHFKVLRECGLIKSERRGVELLNTTRCEELSKRFGDLLPSIFRAYMSQDAPRKVPKKSK